MPDSHRDNNALWLIYDKHYVVVSNARPHQLAVLAPANSLSMSLGLLLRDGWTTSEWNLN